jgi:hypothetical protein
VLSGGHDFVFYAPAACLQSGWTSQMRLGIGEQLMRRLIGDRP